MTNNSRTLEPAQLLAIQRTLFDIPETVTYLNCANMAPYLRTVVGAGVDGVRRGVAPWKRSAEEWFAPSERLRGLVAQIVNADADGIALVPAASYGIAIAAANVEVRPGQAIVLMDGEFPSNVYAWRTLAQRRGAAVRMVTRESGASWTDAVLQGIDDDTAVVSVPNCHWMDGRLVDLERVAAAARSIGAAFVVDASQSLGAYPLDVGRLEPDFVVAVGYKWLLGPYGLGYLYAAPRWRERGVPIEQSWMTRAGAQNFRRLTDYTDAYREGSRRFDAGEFPQFVLTPMAIAALEQVLAWGVDRIQATASALTATIERGAVQLGASVVPAPDRVGHIIGIRPAGGVSPELVTAFAEAHVYVSVRGDSIRVAPHVYNDADDVDRLMSVLRRAPVSA